MTNELFSPDPFSAAGFDLNTAYREVTPAPTPKVRNSWRIYQTKDPNILRSELIVRTLEGGIDMEWGEIDQHNDRFLSSTLDTSVPGYAVIPQVVGTDTVWERNEPVASVSLSGGGTYIGAGSTANKSLYTTHVVGGINASVGLTAATYTPGSQITSLSEIIIGGATTAVQLAIGHASNVINVFGTGNMHANTTGCYGVKISPINANGPRTNLIYANNNIYTLGTDQAIGTAPTSATSGVPNGGFLVDFLSIASQKGSYRGPVRLYAVLPDANQSTSMYGSGSTVNPAKAHIWSFNLEGSDPQPLITTLDTVVHAVGHNGRLYADDGVRSIRYDQGEEDLGWHFTSDRAQGTAGRRLGGYWKAGGDLYTLSVGGTLAVFKLVGKAWHQVSASMAANGSLSISDGSTYPFSVISHSHPMGPLPFDEYNRYLHLPLYSSSGSPMSYHKYVEPMGHSGYDWGWRTADALNVETSGVVTSVKMAFPGALAGRPAVVEEVRYLRDMSSAAGVDYSGASWKIETASQGTAGLTFSGRNYKYNAGDKMPTAGHRFAAEKDAVTRLQWRVTLTRSTGKRSPNALPFVIRMLHFLDGNARSPQECGENAWGVTG